jgi:hypothetical protein
VFIRICAGAWFTASVVIERTIATSSAMPASCGKSSESSAPDWPCRANLNFEPSSAELGLMNAER